MNMMRGVPWAIRKDLLPVIAAEYAWWMMAGPGGKRGEPLTGPAANAEGEPGHAAGMIPPERAGVAQSRYRVENGVAVIPVMGVLSKRETRITRMLGGSSMEQIGENIGAALGRTDVKAILLDVDSPGGTVDGTMILADQVYAVRGRKPIVAFSDGQMMSAAFWIGAAANRVYLSCETCQAGSIGIVTLHTDISEAEKKVGIKTTVMYAGKYKALGNQHEPLSKEAREKFQENIDHVYSLFVRDMAKYRGVSVKAILKDMADGRVFLGNQAVHAGLVDGLATRAVLMGSLSRGVLPAISAGKASTGNTSASLSGEKKGVSVSLPASPQVGKPRIAAKSSAAELAQIPDVLRDERFIARWDSDENLRMRHSSLAVYLYEEYRKPLLGGLPGRR